MDYDKIRTDLLLNQAKRKLVNCGIEEVPAFCSVCLGQVGLHHVVDLD